MTEIFHPEAAVVNPQRQVAADRTSTPTSHPMALQMVVEMKDRVTEMIGDRRAGRIVKIVVTHRHLANSSIMMSEAETVERAAAVVAQEVTALEMIECEIVSHWTENVEYIADRLTILSC